jgi:ribosomal protein L18
VCGKTPFAIDDLGERSLKNIDRPVRLYAARLAVTSQAAAPTRRSSRTNLCRCPASHRSLSCRSSTLDLLNQAIDLDAANGPTLALAVSCHRTIIVYRWSDDAEHHHRQGGLLARRALKAAQMTPQCICAQC